jgi:ADP-ribose pyrophosphatase
MNKKPIQVIQNVHIYSGRVFDLVRERIRLPDNSETDLDIVSHNGAVVIVPVDRAGHMWLIRQYRHPARRVLLEVPAGTLEEGENPDECAQRELREEIGMAARSITKVGQFYLAPGYSTELLHIYVATDLYEAPLPGDIDEIIEVEQVPVGQAYELIPRGEFLDAKSIAALTLARPLIKKIVK